MSNFFQQAEGALENFSQQGGNNMGNDNNQDRNQQDQNQDQNYNDQSYQDQNQNYNDQGNSQYQNQQQSSNNSGGSFFKGAEQAGEDGLINTELNNFMNKEGVPSGADGAVDAFVDKEANQYLGGNNNF
ncbi:uncharacterized protein PV09_09099 [Verruconis gallopava]|uniref:Uncharacterized protein n=1 Tax=Verruconis gallopava TaxID=253628 RepID=A0A0D1XAK4_9PEZI|nr:uncharacterized protein PV09_09099 [Verruconis gallopava]KIV99235.1 hypothetical protein PV09_09099 [Verruconis gallopava]